MASSTWEGKCLWKEHWHWKETLFTVISLWMMCHVLVAGFLKTIPKNFKIWSFRKKKSFSKYARCLWYAAYSREVTLGSSFSLPVSQAEVMLESHPISLPVGTCVLLSHICVSDWWQDAYLFLPCDSAIQAESGLLWSVLLMLHWAVLSKYILGAFLFSWF